MRAKHYIATVMDAEGVANRYVFAARSRRSAEDQARRWVRNWGLGETLVGIEPAVDQKKGARRRRLLAVASVSFAVSGITIIAMMIVGLRLEGAI
jgi:hypothetical protein